MVTEVEETKLIEVGVQAYIQPKLNDDNNSNNNICCCLGSHRIYDSQLKAAWQLYIYITKAVYENGQLFIR